MNRNNTMQIVSSEIKATGPDFVALEEFPYSDL